MQSLIVGKASLRIKFSFLHILFFLFCSCILNFTFVVKKKLCLRLIYNNAILAATVNKKKTKHLISEKKMYPLQLCRHYFYC